MSWRRKPDQWYCLGMIGVAGSAGFLPKELDDAPAPLWYAVTDCFDTVVDLPNGKLPKVGDGATETFIPKSCH